MPPTIGWGDVLLRLALSLIAGALVGLNRSEHGKPAGLRTTVLVCLAASASMVLANLLLATAGRPSDSYAQMDVMRLPLGILTGMGFIGAGAIIRRDELVVGVTTAATLWFVTVAGLCFGAGQNGFGALATVLGLGVLWGFGLVEDRLKRDMRASLTVAATQDAAAERDLLARLRETGYVVEGHAVGFSDHGNCRESRFDLTWRRRPGDTDPPEFLSEIAHRADVVSLRWDPVTL